MKVAVCVPCHSNWSSRTGAAAVGLVRTSMEVFTSRTNTAENMTHAKNNLAWQVKQTEASHVLWIGANISFPQDALHRLIAHDKQIVWAMPHPYDPHNERFFENEKALEEGGLQKIKETTPYIDHGFCLISMSAYDAYPFPWYYEQYGEDGVTEWNGNLIGHVSEDQVFAENMIKAGVEIFCDLDLSKEVIRHRK